MPVKPTLSVLTEEVFLIKVLLERAVVREELVGPAGFFAEVTALVLPMEMLGERIAVEEPDVAELTPWVDLDLGSGVPAALVLHELLAGVGFVLKDEELLVGHAEIAVELLVRLRKVAPNSTPRYDRHGRQIAKHRRSPRGKPRTRFKQVTNCSARLRKSSETRSTARTPCHRKNSMSPYRSPSLFGKSWPTSAGHSGQTIPVIFLKAASAVWLSNAIWSFLSTGRYWTEV